LGATLSHANMDNNFTKFITNFASDTMTGNFSATGNITAYSSDERLKCNFKRIENPIEKLLKINGYEFDWNKQVCDELGFESQYDHEHGVKAQEIQSIMPDVVSIAPFDRKDNKNESKSGENYLTVDYARIVPLLIEAIKEQQKQIEEMKVKY
jgi:hypothetical protein